MANPQTPQYSWIRLALARYQDPDEGVFLLAYTPRQPSIVTENMLRCAYRAGLRGNALLKKDSDCWYISGGTYTHDFRRAGSGRDADSTRSCYKGVSGYRTERNTPSINCTGNGKIGQNPALREERRPLGGGKDKPSTATLGNENVSRHDSTGSHTNASRRISRPNVGSKPERCRPVLLSFRLSPDAMHRDGMSTGNNSEDFYHSPACNSDPSWLSGWESVFPDLRYRKLCAVRNVDGGSPDGLVLKQGCRQRYHQNKAWLSTDDGGGGGGIIEDDAVTAEYLWGSEIAESNA